MSLDLIKIFFVIVFLLKPFFFFFMFLFFFFFLVFDLVIYLFKMLTNFKKKLR